MSKTDCRVAITHIYRHNTCDECAKSFANFLVTFENSRYSLEESIKDMIIAYSCSSLCRYNTIMRYKRDISSETVFLLDLALTKYTEDPAAFFEKLYKLQRRLTAIRN